MRTSPLWPIFGMLTGGAVLGIIGALTVTHLLHRTDRDETAAQMETAAESTLPKSILPMEEMATQDAAVVPLLPEKEDRIPAESLAVSVSGAVRRPGVFNFAEGARVKDGIQAAHGTTEDADVNDINIAARLMDNTSLYIPFLVYKYQERTALSVRRTPNAAEMNPPQYTRSAWVNGNPGPGISEKSPAASSPAQPLNNTTAPGASAPGSGLVNLNSATPAELETLPGVGPKTAEKIDAYRKAQPFRTVDELEEVSGIGAKKMEAIRPMVTVE